jgi:hypothetical protein
LNCNGNIVEDEKHGRVIQIQGDKRQDMLRWRKIPSKKFFGYLARCERKKTYIIRPYKIENIRQKSFKMRTKCRQILKSASENP